MRVVDADVLEMHPEDVARLGFQDRELVRLVSARGQALLPLAVSDRVQPGQLFTSFHFPASEVNVLLSSSADESSKCPEYKVSTVRVEREERDELDSEDEAELHQVAMRLIT
jgi:formate dehydrogenase major subunit